MMRECFIFSYQFVERRKDKTTIWVPPKAAPSLPFGPPAENPKSSDFKKTTVYDHEISLLKDALLAVGMSGGMAVVMSLKFNVHASLIMQAVMMPIGVFEVPVFYKYILGRITKSDGTTLYGELLEAPAEEVTVPAIEEITGNDENDDVPRVEELGEIDE
jgi:hypothetical protein